MGKRQKRIFRLQLQSRQQEYLGQVVNVIMADARTLRGYARELAGEELLVQDMRQRMHRLPLTQVAEVVLDYEAAF